MAFYLTYRPQKISELDLKTARESLGEILSSKTVPHAFLFVGPKGTGKTSSARILAKAVNCTAKKKGSEPCNRCEMCKLISEGKSLDLIEIDAASNRGIDDIRELRDKINLAPSQAEYKVYIIDEVHMLTNEAFNALLKTLEEPPAHAKFVLCTTEPQKLPGTIVSRCFIVKFQKASVEEIVRSLKRVVKGEKLKIKDKDLELIASKADGSFRDATKTLELLAVSGKTISSKRVEEVLHRGVGQKNIDEWLELMYQQKTEPALSWFGEAVADGLNVRAFIVEAVERLRQVMLMRLGVVKGEELKSLGEVGKLKQLIELLMEAGRQVRGAVVESLAVELAIVEWGEGMKIKSQDEPEGEKLEEPKAGIDPKPIAPDKKLTSQAGKLGIEEVVAKWQDVLAAMRPENHSLEALLRATKPTGFDGQFLVLEVFYKFHKERLEQERYRQAVETVASKVLVAPIKVKYYLGEKTEKVVKEKPVDDNISAEEVDDDIIKTAEEVFGVKVD